MSAGKKEHEDVILTGRGIEYARWASLKGRVKMEKVGLKFKGGAIRPKLAAELGLKARDPYDAYIAAIQAKMDAIMAGMVK